MNKEAKEEGRTNGKREVEGDRERVEIQRICLDHVSSKAFEALCPNSEGESFGDSSESSVCVCALFDPSNGACGGFLQLRCERELWSVRWVFSDSECDFVEPQTLCSLHQSRSKCGSRK